MTNLQATKAAERWLDDRRPTYYKHHLAVKALATIIDEAISNIVPTILIVDDEVEAVMLDGGSISYHLIDWYNKNDWGTNEDGVPIPSVKAMANLSDADRESVQDEVDRNNAEAAEDK